jgi:hypothetical protein
MRKRNECCPACGSGVIREVIRSVDYPAILFPIEYEKRFSVATDAIIVMSCEACSHMFLTEIDRDFNRKVYSDYYYLYPYGNLESMEEMYRKPFDSVFRIFSQNGTTGTLLEVGCSSEKQLDLFKAMGYVCSGISPGADSAGSSALMDGFYEDVRFEEEFDCIVSRFNLEHIIDLGVFMEKVHAELKDNGMLFVQVPNVECFLNSGVISVFAHEHPQYFCKSSLAAALTRASFQLEFIKAEDSDPSIIAVARKPKTSLRISDRVKANLHSADAILDIMSHAGDADFVFYGAGLSLIGLLYLDARILGYKDRIAVIDDNEIIAGRYMPNTDLKVIPLDSRETNRGAILFVFLNRIYHSRVFAKAAAAGFESIYFLDGTGVCKHS